MGGEEIVIRETANMVGQQKNIWVTVPCDNLEGEPPEHLCRAEQEPQRTMTCRKELT